MNKQSEQILSTKEKCREKSPNDNNLEITILRRLFVNLANRFSPNTKGFQVINEAKEFVEVLGLTPEKELKIMKILNNLEKELVK